MSELNIKSISQGFDGSLIRTTLDDYSFFLPEGGTMDKGEFDGLYAKAKEHGVPEVRVSEFLIGLGKHFRTELPVTEPVSFKDVIESIPYPTGKGWGAPNASRCRSNQPFVSRKINGLFVLDSNNELFWLNTEGDTEKVIDHIDKLLADRGITREKAKELIAGMIKGYTGSDGTKGPTFIIDSIPRNEPWTKLLHEWMGYITTEEPLPAGTDVCIQYDQEPEQPEPSPEKMKGNGKRELVTTKGGYTYPKPKTRR